MNLYIIGNGFDIHHHMNTQYLDYKCFLEQHYPVIARDFSSCKYLVKFGDLDLWNDVEESLELMCDDYFEDLCNLYPDIASEKTPRWTDFTLAAKNDFGFLIPFTGTLFKEWISNIRIKDPDLKLQIEKDGYFLSFNYTYTLEQAYHIETERIFHIHGDINSKIEFGSPRKVLLGTKANIY